MTFSAAALTAFAVAGAQASATALAGGTLEIIDASGVILASLGLGTPTAAGAITTMGGFPKSGAANASGTAASARYRKSDATDWKVGMTVGISGAQVNLSSLVIESGQSVTINSATLTHSAI